MFRSEEFDYATLKIAEVGQNHQGDIALAREYIRVFSSRGADVIKFQRRHLGSLFSSGALARPYDNENSFGSTYGEHREALELSLDDLAELKDSCRRAGVQFAVTAFDEGSLRELLELEVDILKISSFDCGNLPFLSRLAGVNVPIVLSTGGANLEQIRESVQVLGANPDVAILHCVSRYPTSAEDLNLDQIAVLKSEFPDSPIGLSDHFGGTLSGPVGYLKGARVFEKHVTLDRSMKGTDHSFALEPRGFELFCRDIDVAATMNRPARPFGLGKEPVFSKLGKSIVAARKLLKGETVTLGSIRGIIHLEGVIPIRESHSVLGKKMTRDASPGEPLAPSDFE